MYSAALAYVHEAGFGGHARRVAPEVVQVLRRHGIRSGRVIEFGCGGGTLARHLTGRGYNVLGIDISPAMLRIARQRAPHAVFRVGSLTTARLPKCRAIVAIGEVVSYVIGDPHSHRRDLTRFLRRARRALEPGGVLLFDFISSTAGRTYGLKHRRGAGWSIAVRAAADRKGRVIVRDLVIVAKIQGTVTRAREKHRVRVYSREEMSALLAAAGFAVTMRRSIGRAQLMRSDLAAIACLPPASPSSVAAAFVPQRDAGAQSRAASSLCVLPLSSDRT